MAVVEDIAREDWRLRDAAELTDDVILEAAKDAQWRIRHLYWVIDKNKQEVLFRPWPEQEKFLRRLWYRNIILKARQRGFSTLIQLMMLDACMFTPNTSAAVIAQDQDAANVIFRKIKYAYDRLPEVLKADNPLVTDSKSELQLANGSSLRVATSVRSATLNWLHVSEFGKICAKFPLKADEVVSGSLPAVPPTGVVCIESTAEGQEGHFYTMCQTAQANKEAAKKLSRREYRFQFASWWDAAEFETDPDGIIITKKDHAYFNRLEAELGIELSLEKRAWYVATRENDFNGDQDIMFREYKSSPEEAFSQSSEGVYLPKQLSQARLEGRITHVPYIPDYPVNTWWDLGLDLTTCCWFHQRVGLRDHWIRFLEGAPGAAYEWFVTQMQGMGYVWGHHYLPHDGATRKAGAEALKTTEDMLYDLGLRNLIVVPRTPDLEQIGIPQLRSDFVNYWFDEQLCAEGVKHLGLYKRQWNSTVGAWTDHPLKNGHDHAADALRQKAQYFADVHQPKRKRQRPSGLAA